MAGFDDWLGKLGEALGKTPEVQTFLEEERTKYLPKIAAVREKLQGLRAVKCRRLTITERDRRIFFRD
ncbi:MAG TPA: hypothetical protein DCO75_01955 [Fibrobacteres bacterium]|jgi:nitrogenase molybdenum-iron protein alpha chain|nr:hypothetical protein [Fibrobacterota bacterium]